MKNEELRIENRKAGFPINRKIFWGAEGEWRIKNFNNLTNLNSIKILNNQYTNNKYTNTPIHNFALSFELYAFGLIEGEAV